MPNGERRPLLRMPAPERADRERLGGGQSNVHLPAHRRQIERVAPQFERLEQAFEARRLELRDELAGVEPELALVFETVGSVQDFHRAVRRIDGMEWLVDIEESGIEADDDFFQEGDDDREGSLSGVVYLIMSDRRAVEELLRHWSRYSDDEDCEWAYGQTKWRDLFRCLKEVRLWGPRDRLRETGLVEDWQARLALEGDEPVRAQAELWYRHDADRRTEQLRRLENSVQQSGGRLIGQSTTIPEIAYQGCIIEVPRNVAQQIADLDEVELLRCESVMFYRPVGQLATSPEPGDVAEVAEQQAAPADPNVAVGDPLVAMLDGLPLEGHTALAGRLTVDDPDGWADRTPASDRKHGTSIASTVIHGDLSQPTGPLSRPVYVRPILRPVAGTPEPWEAIPEDVLEVDLIHRSVRRILVGGAGGDVAVAPDVSVINLSIGDLSRPFSGTPSPLARLLDWLSWKHSVLFIVSAGNAGQGRTLRLDCLREDLAGLAAEELQRESWKGLSNDAQHRRLLSPAETVNGLTVGCAHSDHSNPRAGTPLLDPFAASHGQCQLPSPIGALGSGVGRSIKPDVHYPGGRVFYSERRGTNHTHAELIPRPLPATAPGVLTASPGSAEGVLNAQKYSHGTSTAAALATHDAGCFLEQIETLFGEGQLPSRRALIPLVKAALVHGSRWGPAKEVVTELTRHALGLEAGDTVPRRMIDRFLGYGFPDSVVHAGCNQQRVTLAGWGELDVDEADVFRIPLPPSLSAQRVWRRLTVTLAWNGPLNPNDRRYRMASVWFKPSHEGVRDTQALLGLAATDADRNATNRGTIQHEVFEGERSQAYVDGEELILKVSCRELAGRLVEAIPYALLMSLEVAPETQLPIYEEIRQRLRPRVDVRA